MYLKNQNKNNNFMINSHGGAISFTNWGKSAEFLIVHPYLRAYSSGSAQVTPRCWTSWVTQTSGGCHSTTTFLGLTTTGSGGAGW